MGRSALMASIVALLLAPASAQAFTLICGGAPCDSGDTNATGIVDLEVLGTTYNVTFVEGSAEEVYGPSPGVFDFDETPSEEAVTAVADALASEPSIVTVGPASRADFDIGYASAPGFALVQLGFYLLGWNVSGTEEGVPYSAVRGFADFTIASGTPLCGDGVPQSPEECDPPDGVTCDDECMDILVECGNDILQPGEECDGSDDAACPGACEADCLCAGGTEPICGDDVVDDGEQCDPPDGVTCDALCQDIPISCGNDLRQPGEECDGSDDAACPGECLGDCTCNVPPQPICGDDVIDAGEQCDPPDGVTCDALCQDIPISCGNDLRQPGEECDGSDDAACPGACREDCFCSGAGPYCGDGVVDLPDEECDGDDAEACALGCLPNCTCQTVAICPFQADPSCVAADKGSLKIDEKKEGKEKLKASVEKLQEATTLADFGDPVSGMTLYEVCVYGEGATLVAPLRVDRGGDVCGAKAKPCWKAKKKGPAYKDPDAASGGVKKITTKSGDAGKGSVKADAGNNAKKGQMSLPTGVTDRLVGATQVTVQVRADAQCFSATLDEVKKNDAEQFQAKLKN